MDQIAGNYVLRRDVREWCERELQSDATIELTNKASQLKQYLITHPDSLNTFVDDHLHFWCLELIRAWLIRQRKPSIRRVRRQRALQAAHDAVSDVNKRAQQARDTEMQDALDEMLGPIPLPRPHEGQRTLSDLEEAAAWYRAAGSLSNDEIRERRIAAWNTTASRWAQWREQVGAHVSLELPMMTRPQLLSAAGLRRARADNESALASLWNQLADGLADDTETVRERYAPGELEELASVTLGATVASDLG